MPATKTRSRSKTRKTTTRKKPATKKVAKKKTTARKKPATKKVAKKKTTARKKPAAKKTTKKASTRKSAAKKPASKKIKVGKKPYTKSELFSTISESTGLTKKEVSSVFEQFSTIIFAHVNGSAKQFTVPGIAKIVVNRKPATKARKGINPFTGEPTVFKAKPARNVVKIRPLKALKEAAK